MTFALWASASSIKRSRTGSPYTFHQRASRACTPSAGASRQPVGRSTAGFVWSGFRPAQPARSNANPRIESLRMAVLRFQRNMVRNIGRLARVLALDLGAQFRRGAALGQPPVGDKLEEQRHEKDREESRRQHSAHDARTDGTPRAEIARGSTPKMNASEVIRIGRKRSRAASSAAAAVDRPSWCFSTAYSTIRMAFFAARPSSVTSPIWKYTSLVNPRSHTAASAPNVPNGSASRTDSGSDHFSYCAARIRNTISAASASAMPAVPLDLFSWNEAPPQS